MRIKIKKESSQSNLVYRLKTFLALALTAILIPCTIVFSGCDFRRECTCDQWFLWGTIPVLLTEEASVINREWTIEDFSIEGIELREVRKLGLFGKYRALVLEMAEAGIQRRLESIEVLNELYFVQIALIGPTCRIDYSISGVVVCEEKYENYTVEDFSEISSLIARIHDSTGWWGRNINIEISGGYIEMAVIEYILNKRTDIIEWTIIEAPTGGQCRARAQNCILRNR